MLHSIPRKLIPHLEYGVADGAASQLLESGGPCFSGDRYVDTDSILCTQYHVNGTVKCVLLDEMEHALPGEKSAFQFLAAFNAS